MSVSESLGDGRTVKTPAGTMEYRERGTGPPIVFPRGWRERDLWRKVAPELHRRPPHRRDGEDDDD